MKFQVGNKVQIAKCTYKFWKHVGAIGEVLELRTYGRHSSPTHYLIKFDCYKIPHIYYSEQIDELCRKYTTQYDEKDIVHLKRVRKMTITEKEVKEDFARFIRHEAMRANCTQNDIKKIIYGETSNS